MKRKEGRAACTKALAQENTGSNEGGEQNYLKINGVGRAKKVKGRIAMDKAGEGYTGSVNTGFDLD